MASGAQEPGTDPSLSQMHSTKKKTSTNKIEPGIPRNSKQEGWETRVYDLSKLLSAASIGEQESRSDSRERGVNRYKRANNSIGRAAGRGQEGQIAPRVSRSNGPHNT